MDGMGKCSPVLYLFGDDPIFGKFLFETVFGLILLAIKGTKKKLLNAIQAIEAGWMFLAEL